MLDEREGDVAAHELDRAFNRQSVWRRIAIVAAGPLANLLLAFLLLCAGWYALTRKPERAVAFFRWLRRTSTTVLNTDATAP